MEKKKINQLPEFQISMKTKCKASELFTVHNSIDAAQVCRHCFEEDKIEWVESFIVIALSRSNKCIGFYKVSQGGVTGTIADPRVIMQFAILCNASALILSHNHPSGNITPSQADKDLTKKIKGAAELFDMKILDHIIITAEEYFSFGDEGLL